MQQTDDIINHPKHYTDASLVLESMMISEHFSSRDGQVLQYIMRAGKKVDAGETAAEAELRDLKKALFWLNRRRAVPVRIEHEYSYETGIVLDLVARYSTGVLHDDEYDYRYGGGGAAIEAYFNRLQVRVSMRIDILAHDCYLDVEI